MNLILDFLDDHLGIVLVFVLILVLVGAVCAMIYDERNWQKYAAQHHCEKKGTRRGQIAVGPSANGGKDGGVGVAITQEPDQTIYVCDGGEIVIR